MYIFHSRIVFLFIFVSITSSISLTFASGFEPMDRDLIIEDNQIINNQIIKQSNTCGDMANCQNELSIHDFTISKEDTSSNSEKTVTQINECSQDQTCLNSVNKVNNVFGEDTPTGDSTVSENIYQSCGPDDGPVCLNTNNMFVDVSKGLP
ncbi:MAG: hypothetical protein K0S93_150 [Nitrososphaeraceae archaeon]|nr:hypothetical protein [Nitrososphaeraceae archaeon]MDF2736294.1 hypothetical protein [Nitrososphaeraceae archaeon]